MIKADDFRKRIDEFLEITFYLTEEELQAVDHIIPMTQELFDSIVDKCATMDVEDFFFQMLDEYPEFLAVHAERIEKGLD